MKIIHLTDLCSGQPLSHNWLHLAVADDTRYPINEGYRVYHRGHCLGECKVVERRTIKWENVTDMLAHMICGYNRQRLADTLGFEVYADTKLFLIQFQYIRYYEPMRKAMAEALELNVGKNTMNKPFQYAI